MNPGNLADHLREAAETMPTAADRLPATFHRAARLRRRRRGLAVASTAAAVTAVLAGSLLVSARSPGEPTPLPAASASPLGTPVGTVRIAAARLAGTTLTVSFTGAPDTGPTDPCWHRYEVEATETDRVVTVVVQDYGPAVPLAPGQGCTRMGYSRLMPVPLAGSLGARTVVDRSTGSAVSVLRDVLTLPRPSQWRLRAEYGDEFNWQQAYSGPDGEFILSQGRPALGTLSNPAFFEQTGATTVRGTPAAWGTAPGETSLHWVEGDSGFQLLSPDLDVEQLVEIAADLAG